MIISQTDKKVNLNLCPWCYQDMGPPKSRGAHRRNCPLNPNHAKTIEKIIATAIKKKSLKEQETIIKICTCGKEFKFTRIKGSKTYIKNFCSRKCANSRIFTETTRKKISAALISYTTPSIQTHQDKICPICNKPFTHRKAKTCSAECGTKLRYQNPEHRLALSKSLKGKTGGWRNFGGNGLKGYYEGILYQSSWELAWLVYHIDHKIPFRRCIEFFEYEFNGKKSKYFPDFFLENEQIYIEIKGFMCKRTQAKIASVSNIKVLMKNEMQKFLSYARAKGVIV